MQSDPVSMSGAKVHGFMGGGAAAWRTASFTLPVPWLLLIPSTWISPCSDGLI